MNIRIVCSIGMMLIGLFLPYWVFAILALVYACIWTPYELVILAVCIDAEFGRPELGIAYMYTLTVGILSILGIYIKPLFKFYKSV